MKSEFVPLRSVLILRRRHAIWRSKLVTLSRSFPIEMRSWLDVLIWCTRVQVRMVRTLPVRPSF